MIKHTPGPWSYRHTATTGLEYFIDSKQYVCIARASCESDARLIATAPELLAQLKYVREVLGAWLPEKSKALVAECSVVIAKAEGSKE